MCNKCNNVLLQVTGMNHLDTHVSIRCINLGGRFLQFLRTFIVIAIVTKGDKKLMNVSYHYLPCAMTRKFSRGIFNNTLIITSSLANFFVNRIIEGLIFKRSDSKFHMNCFTCEQLFKDITRSQQQHRHCCLGGTL